jgi:hypothetical protein
VLKGVLVRTDMDDFIQSEADALLLMVNFSDDEVERAAATEHAQGVATAFCSQWWLCPF